MNKNLPKLGIGGRIQRAIGYNRRFMKRSFPILITLLALGAPAPRQDVWTVIGPGGGGAMFYPTVSPHDPRTAVVACDMTGSYITHDGGESWRMFNLRQPVRMFAFDPSERRTIYAGAAELFRSTDNGDTWQLVYPSPKTVKGVTMGDDHAGERVTGPAEGPGTIAALAVDPADSHMLYAAARIPRQPLSLWISKDWGATWEKSADLPGGARNIWVDPHSPKGNPTLYVAGTNAMAVRENGAWRTGDSPGTLTGVSVGFPASGPAVVYATAGDKIYVSDDGGLKWRESPLPGFQARVSAIAASLLHPDVAYVSYNGLRSPLTAHLGVAKTTDRGRHWELVRKDAQGVGDNVHEAWQTARFGAGWGSNPLGIGVSPNNPDICFTTDYGRTFRTYDGGKTWQAAYSTQTADGGWTTTGLDVTTCYGVHFDPFDPKHMFISYTDIGLFGSNNGGASWTSATVNGVPRPWVNTTYWIEFDPQARGRIWGVMSGVHDLPRPKMWRSRSPERYNGGVCLSEDGGRTWRVTSEGMPPTAATHILLDPGSPVQARVLYVAGFGRGVFKSVDGGGHWALKNSGIEGAQPFAWRLARDSRGTLYLVVARRNEGPAFGNEGDGALYRSSDGAEHWTRILLPKGVNGPNGLAIDPRDPRRLYLAAWGRSTPEGALDGGIFLSTDGGTTWRNTLARDQHIYDVTVDPRDPDVIYASGFESSAWRSTDRGRTWRRIRGYNFKWGHRVIPDPVDKTKIYITTFGGSVWHGPTAGDPKASEDIAGGPLAYSAK